MLSRTKIPGLKLVLKGMLPLFPDIVMRILGFASVMAYGPALGVINIAFLLQHGFDFIYLQRIKYP